MRVILVAVLLAVGVVPASALAWRPSYDQRTWSGREPSNGWRDRSDDGYRYAPRERSHSWDSDRGDRRDDWDDGGRW